MASGASQLRAALWLQPKPGSQLHTALRQTIAGLAPVFEDAPRFDPHVTIVSGINVQTDQEVDFVLDSMLAAAKSVPHLDVVLEGVTYGRVFFRKVVLEAHPAAELVSLAAIAQEEYVRYPQLRREHFQQHKKAPDPEQIHELHQQASQYASKWVREEFRPHLSLVYSDIYPVTEAIRHTVHQRLKDVFGAHYETRGIGWTGGRISLVLCEGPVEEWQVLGYRDI